MATYNDYWMLTGYWILFCVVHHITATEKCKSIFQVRMGAGFRYYRLIYTSLALVSFVFVLFKQFSIKSDRLEIVPWFKYFVGTPLGILGICVMFASIRKYFFKLSGIGVFYARQQPASLEFDGVHQYIRHPLYLGTLLLIWSLFLFFPLLTNLMAFLVMTTYVLIGIRFEEKKLLLIFGEIYKKYRDKTPGLIPHIRIQITLLP